MRALFVTRLPEVGSLWKYRNMFARECELRVVDQRRADRLEDCDVAIVYGDRKRDHLPAIGAGIPYILIANDVMSARSGGDHPGERQMIEYASAVLFTSDAMRDYCERRYALPPSTVVALRPLLSDVTFEPLPKLPGENIVFAGGILPENHANTEWGYRVYHRIMHGLMAHGLTVHIYPTPVTDKHAESYAAIGCVMHKPVDERDLYRELSQYQLGLQAVGPVGDAHYERYGAPNKTWLYLGAGIPTLGVNPGPGGEVFDGKWGAVAKNIEGIPRAIKRALSVPITDELRGSQVIDHDSGKFRWLLEIATAKAAVT